MSMLSELSKKTGVPVWVFLAATVVVGLIVAKLLLG